MICEKEIPEVEDWGFTELYMICESCKKDIKAGKYGNDIIELLKEYSVEKQKAELKKDLEAIESTYPSKAEAIYPKEVFKQMREVAIFNTYQRRHSPFGEATNLKTKTTKNLNLHLWLGSNEKQKYHYANYIEKYRFYQRALKIHNDIFNDLTQKAIDKYLKVYSNAELEEQIKPYHEKLEIKRKKGYLKFEKKIINSHIVAHEKNLRRLNEGICPVCYGTIKDKQPFIDKELNEIEQLNRELEGLRS
ncbi:hypothetical protein ES705_23609 [subsurface metagenome]